jgi:hypothetical protein
MSVTLEEKRPALADPTRMRKLVILCGILAVGLMSCFFIGVMMLQESRAEVLPIRESDKGLVPTAQTLIAAGESQVVVSEYWRRVRVGGEETIKYVATSENDKTLLDSELIHFASADAAHARFTERRAALLDSEGESADDFFSWGDHSVYRMSPTVQTAQIHHLLIRRGTYLMEVKLEGISSGVTVASIVQPALQELDFALMDSQDSGY